MMRFIVLFILILTFVSCHKEDRNLQRSLQLAGTNRLELEAVLDHYKDDSLKLKAASFLISNMRDLYTSDGKSMDLYYQAMNDCRDLLKEQNVFDVRSLYDSILKQCTFPDSERSYDLNQIRADYLIRRIDHAFKAWQSPWAMNLGFDDFCEYLLPYRIDTEVLEDWEPDYKSHFQFAFEDVDLLSDSSLYKVCEALSKEYKTNGYSYPAGMPAIKPSLLKHLRVAPCTDFANLFVFFGRTFGMPAAIDLTPQWTNHSKGHSWSVVIYKGKTLYYMPGEGVPRPAYEKRFTYQLAKVFRKTYGIQPNSLAVLASGEELPAFFRNSRMRDVTKEYIAVTDLSVDTLNEHQQRGNRVYLAVFDDKNWMPVAWGDIQKRNKTTIKDVGYPAVYLPVYYINGQCIAAQYPVKIDKNGKPHSLTPKKDELQTVALKRKFMDNRAWQFVEYLKGGRFQLADNHRFHNPREYHIPDTAGYNYQTISVSDEQKYRYIRYLPKPNTGGDIAEIEVYNEEGIQINGKIIGKYIYTTDTIHGMERAFDGRVLSYAKCDHTQGDQWIGLDLGKPSTVSKILYLPRSDDNFIKDKELYELFYWDGQWVSLGKQAGNKQSQVLIYNHVPVNSLLLLRNHTKGVEERIFTYENDRQVWW